MGFWPMRGGTLCGIEKLPFYRSSVNQNVTVGNWVEHWILGVGHGVGKGRGEVRQPGVRVYIDIVRYIPTSYRHKNNHKYKYICIFGAADKVTLTKIEICTCISRYIDVQRCIRVQIQVKIQVQMQVQIQVQLQLQVESVTSTRRLSAVWS